MTELTNAQKAGRVERQRCNAVLAREAADDYGYGGPVLLILVGIPLCIIGIGALMILAGIVWAIIRAVNKPKLEAAARAELVRLEDMAEQYGIELRYEGLDGRIYPAMKEDE